MPHWATEGERLQGSRNQDQSRSKQSYHRKVEDPAGFPKNASLTDEKIVVNRIRIVKELLCTRHASCAPGHVVIRRTTGIGVLLKSHVNLYSSQALKALGDRNHLIPTVRERVNRIQDSGAGSVSIYSASCAGELYINRLYRNSGFPPFISCIPEYISTSPSPPMIIWLPISEHGCNAKRDRLKQPHSTTTKVVQK